MTGKLFVLFEHASGYALIKSKAKSVEAIIETASELRENYDDFSKYFKLHVFSPFSSAANALENCNAISEGVIHDDLRAFLSGSLPLDECILLCVAERKLAEVLNSPESELPDSCKCSCETSLLEFFRILRLHFPRYISGLSHFEESKAQIGLGHSYSRAKVKYNVHRQDNMIIQTINLLDQIDKDINIFSMRVKEWFSYHFPELVKIVPDNSQFVKVVTLIKNRDGATEENRQAIEDIIGDSDKTTLIIEAAKTSMGFDITDQDSEHLSSFTQRIVTLIKRRVTAHAYLLTKLECVAPNLSTLIGTQVSARLIAHAGSLTNLAKFPASTIQILGAEKALFRALKLRGNTPKYGLIFHSTFIGRAAKENKGRISRFLAAKCAIASRIDCFSENLCNVFGTHLRQQVEDRLSYFETGIRPKTNAEAMAVAVVEARKFIKKLKKRSIDTIHRANAKRSDSENEATAAVPVKKKKKKKAKLEQEENGIIADAGGMPINESINGDESKPLKKKKKRNYSECDASDADLLAITNNGSPKKKKRALSESFTNDVNGENETINSPPKKKKNKLHLNME